LHFTFTFTLDFADFKTEKTAESRFLFAQSLTNLTDDFAAGWGWERLPSGFLGLEGGNAVFVVHRVGLLDDGDGFLVGGRDHLHGGTAACVQMARVVH